MVLQFEYRSISVENTNDFFFIKIYILKSLKKAKRVSLAETDWKELTDNSGCLIYKEMF